MCILFHTAICGLGLGLEHFGLGLGLAADGLGLGLGLGTAGLDYKSAQMTAVCCTCSDCSYRHVYVVVR